MQQEIDLYKRNLEKDKLVVKNSVVGRNSFTSKHDEIRAITVCMIMSIGSIVFNF